MKKFVTILLVIFTIIINAFLFAGCNENKLPQLNIPEGIISSDNSNTTPDANLPSGSLSADPQLPSGSLSADPQLPSGYPNDSNITTPDLPEKKIEVAIYIDGEVSDIIYADSNTGKITPPKKPHDITTNPNYERYFYGWFTDAFFHTPYTDETKFDGSQSLYGKWISVYPSNFTYTVDRGVATITGYLGNSNTTVLVIPAYINSFPIKTISTDAFKNKTQLRTVIVCNGIEVVSGFSGCNSLTKINLPESVTTIDSYAFYDCDSLSDINYLPESINYIEKYAFANCNNLTSIEIPSNVKNIDKYAFEGCDNIVKAIIPTIAISSIPKNNLKNVIINGGKSIYNSAFMSCDSLESIDISSSVTCIDNYAFAACRNLTNITISNSITFIGGYAFTNCDSLKSIVIPCSVTKIAAFAFSSCDILTSIYIPYNVMSIEYKAFEDCKNLTIFCEHLTKPSDWSDRWNISNCPVIWGYKYL